MKKFLSVFAILIITLSLGFKSSAQDYPNAIGVKLGTYQGVTFRHYLSKGTALEGTFTFGNNTLGVTGAYQIYLPLPEIPKLSWYFGGGGHLIFVNGYNVIWNNYNSESTKKNNKMAFGVNGVIGLDYTIPGVPINVGAEAGPYINLLDEAAFNAYLGIFARYTF